MMERIRETGRRLHRVYRETIEWRNPLTGLYLMAVNSAFWIGVIYCDPRIQEALLATASAGIFAWDILLSSSNDRSIITHLLMWPFQSIFRTLSVGGSVYSIHLLRAEEVRLACYSAYATLACLLINPVWEHNEVNAKIGSAVQKTASWFGNWIQYLIITPIVTVYEYTKYIVLFRWVPRKHLNLEILLLKNFSINCTYKTFRLQFPRSLWRTSHWNQELVWFSFDLSIELKRFFRFHVTVIERTERVAERIRKFLRYWFCAEWWPSLKEWLKINVGVPLRYLFDQLCFVFVYIFCAHWFPPLWRFTVKQLKVLGALAHKHLWVPVKGFLFCQFERLRCWLRDTLHSIAIAVRDSIIWPICVLMVEVGKQCSIFVYHLLLEPVVNYLYGRYKIIETSALIYILGPVCETVIDHIPEKNPFCEDSDVEFDGFLPEVNDDTDLDENMVDNEDDEMQSQLSSSPIPEEEFEFERGLKFSAVNGSESSDAEFDLEAPKRTVRRRRREPRKSDMAVDDEYELLE
ncbi:Protein CBG09774 [Caenorhabditis briggsae]|uniref:Protein CBG09774 n=1 Tax=Caenorhabditis briggsae TaxID=6238 RepID=A8X9L4_CAEBR|nr:Protein CBG09774 [Caenorhabditis briggsae]CAP29329.2 Protein CBG09774 [Caenorhabditis briggsae]